MRRILASIILVVAAMQGAFALPNPELKLSMPAEAGAFTGWINSGWTIDKATISASASASSAEGGSAKSRVYTEASYGYLTAVIELSASALAEQSVAASGGSGDEPAVQSTDTLLINSVAYKDSHGITHKALAPGTEVSITLDLGLNASIPSGGALNATLTSFGYFKSSVKFVSEGPKVGDEDTGSLLTQNGNPFVIPDPVTHATQIIHAWVGGTVQVDCSLEALGVLAETSVGPAIEEISTQYSGTSKLTTSEASGITVKSLSGALY